MKRAITIATLLLFLAVPAAAQTEGRVSVGGSVTFVKPTDSEVGSLVGMARWCGSIRKRDGALRPD